MYLSTPLCFVVLPSTTLRFYPPPEELEDSPCRPTHNWHLKSRLSRLTSLPPMLLKRSQEGYPSVAVVSRRRAKYPMHYLPRSGTNDSVNVPSAALLMSCLTDWPSWKICSGSRCAVTGPGHTAHRCPAYYGFSFPLVIAVTGLY